MTATERLRALLDERGVEHIDYEDEATWWSNGNVECAYIQSAILGDEFGQLSFMATPEQAIAATLGRGTCKWEPADFITEGDWWNTSCGGSFTWEPDGTPNYCPGCGREVEQ